MIDGLLKEGVIVIDIKQTAGYVEYTIEDTIRNETHCLYIKKGEPNGKHMDESYNFRYC